VPLQKKCLIYQKVKKRRVGTATLSSGGGKENFKGHQENADIRDEGLLGHR
jgi:hypothetical protein